MTADGHPDLLVDADTNGSAGCGVYRVLATVHNRLRTLLRLDQCLDDGIVELVRGGLLVTTRIGKDPKTAQSIHCCYLSVRRTIIRWPNGKPVRTSIVRPNLGRWPPH